MEVYKYRSSKVVPQDSTFSETELIDLNQRSRKEIRTACYNYCSNIVAFTLGKFYCFTASELHGVSRINLQATEAFLKCFSCDFPSVAPSDTLVGPDHILKRKPLLEHGGRYLVASLPLLSWCVEPEIEDYIKSQPKLQNKFKGYKHDFLMRKGAELMKQVLRDEVETFYNLYYYTDETKSIRCETDGIFKYARILFIVEGKGNRISIQAKTGKINRTEKHLEDIVKDSYEQGLRTWEYIANKKVAEFFTNAGKKIKFNRADIDEVILVSLVLEPIGNIVPLIRATNDLGYFKPPIFPWIVSLYDLIVIADHLEESILLPHYIKRRKEFLEKKIMYAFDEMDILSSYLYNRLYIEGLHDDAVDKNVNMVYMDTDSDGINNYYMHKYKLKNPDPPKVQLKMPGLIRDLMQALKRSSLKEKQEIMLRILDMPPFSLQRLEAAIRKIKAQYVKDGKQHDCSLLTQNWGQKVGFTYMAGPDKLGMDSSMHMYGHYKASETGADCWVAIGDVARRNNAFVFESAMVIKGIQKREK